MSFSKSILKNPSFFFIKTLKSVFFLFITLNNYYCYYSYFLKSLCNIHQEQLLPIFFFFFSLFQHTTKISNLLPTYDPQQPHVQCYSVHDPFCFFFFLPCFIASFNQLLLFKYPTNFPRSPLTSHYNTNISISSFNLFVILFPTLTLTFTLQSSFIFIFFSFQQPKSPHNHKISLHYSIFF